MSSFFQLLTDIVRSMTRGALGNSYQVRKATPPLTSERLSNTFTNQPASALTEELRHHIYGDSLDLTAQQITELPPALSQLTNLTHIYLSDNQLTTLPPEIAHLTNLTHIYLGNNQLTTLPPEIAHLTNLTVLLLANNQLASLPPEIWHLTKLIRLDLRGNQLRTLPPEIGQLTSLRGLDLRGNQLRTLPPEIGQLINLTQPSSGDGIEINAVQGLHIDMNPLISPPPEIVAQGTEAVLSYLQSSLKDGQKEWVSKLLLVGQGGVGKTSLLNILLGKKFNPEEQTTHGLEVRSLMLPHPSESGITIQLNAWDFGGQEIYHATHQFFLTNRSLFLIVWNARHGYEQGKLYYWLDTIQANAPESPVLLIATHIDERDADLPFTDICRKYPQVVRQCSISNKTGEGIEVLQQNIAEVASTLPLMGEIWSKRWLEAAHALRSCQEYYINLRSIRKLMMEHQVEEKDTSILIQWMHELGDLLYFPDDDELNEIIILKPQWVSEYISLVLESKEVIGRVGVFTRMHMLELWTDLSPEMQDHFLRLMDKFDLSYRTLENREISLVVERLPLDEADYSELWDSIREREPCNEINMKFQLNTLPAGIPTWFIARSHRFTTYKHWRFGALFTDGPDHKHLGLVKALPHDHCVQLTVRGPWPQNFFALLRDGLELTLARFPGLNIERRLPCPGRDSVPCSHEFTYDQLIHRLEQTPPRETIECPACLDHKSVTSLLFGLHRNTYDTLLSHLDELLKGQKGLETEMHDLRALTQREFTKAFRREQRLIESHCPNVFVLRPSVSQSWPRRLAGQDMALQLYCQAPGFWHPTFEGGLYFLQVPAKWLQVMAPYIQKMVTVLKFVVPLLGPWVGISNRDYQEQVKHDLKLMEELVKKLPEEILEETLRLGGSHDVEQVEGASLRVLRALLLERDPQQHWGGLKKVLTPEGHYLWLCDYHTKTYST